MIASEFVDMLALAFAEGQVTVITPPAQLSAPPRPGFMCGPVPEDMKAAFFGPSDLPGTYVMELRDVIVSQEGLVSQGQTILSSYELGFHESYLRSHHPNSMRTLPDFRLEDVAETVVLLSGPGHLIYGHWLVDFLPKLYLLHEVGYDITTLRYLLPGDAPRVALQWLELLGLTAQNFVRYNRLAQAVKCRHLVVPTCLRTSSRVLAGFVAAKDFLLARIKPTLASPPPRKLLIVRSSNASTMNKREFERRDALHELAIRNGYCLFKPEQQTLIDQLAVFRSAQAICGEYGSGMHNSMWSHDSIFTLSIRDDSVGLGLLQLDIDHACANTACFVIGKYDKVGGGFSAKRQDVEAGFELMRSLEK